MPPHPYLFEGIDVIEPLIARAFGDERRRMAARADPGQPDADGGELSPRDRATRSTGRSSSTCCAIEDGRIAEITTFGAELFPAFGLPPTL